MTDRNGIRANRLRPDNNRSSSPDYNSLHPIDIRDGSPDDSLQPNDMRDSDGQPPTGPRGSINRAPRGPRASAHQLPTGPRILNHLQAPGGPHGSVDQTSTGPRGTLNHLQAPAARPRGFGDPGPANPRQTLLQNRDRTLAPENTADRALVPMAAGRGPRTQEQIDRTNARKRNAPSATSSEEYEHARPAQRMRMAPPPLRPPPLDPRGRMPAAPSPRRRGDERHAFDPYEGRWSPHEYDDGWYSDNGRRDHHRGSSDRPRYSGPPRRDFDGARRRGRSPDERAVVDDGRNRAEYHRGPQDRAIYDNPRRRDRAPAPGDRGSNDRGRYDNPRRRERSPAPGFRDDLSPDPNRRSFPSDNYDDDDDEYSESYDDDFPQNPFGPPAPNFWDRIDDLTDRLDADRARALFDFLQHATDYEWQRFARGLPPRSGENRPDEARRVNENGVWLENVRAGATININNNSTGR